MNTMQLLQKLRAQLPPEATDKLDELEGMVDGHESDEGTDEPTDGGPMDSMGAAQDDGQADDDSGSAGLGEDDSASDMDTDYSDDEGSDEPADVNARAELDPKKKKAKGKPGLKFFA